MNWKKLIPWKKQYELSQLNGVMANMKNDRSNFKIAIIDDQNIGLIKKLKNHNYDVKHFLDIEHLSDLERFNIVICDIQGVGKKFGSKFEGAHLIKEIKRIYPLKYLIGFSGKSFDPTFNKYFSLCDDVMQKRVDVSEWIACLEKAMRNIKSPIYNWEKARRTFLEHGISLNEVSNLEQVFIKSLLQKEISHFDNFTSKRKASYSNVVATIDAVGTYLSFAQSLIS